MTNRFKKIVLGVAALAALALGGSALAGAATGGKEKAPEASTEAPGGEQSGAGDTDNVQNENGKDDASEGPEKADGSESGKGDAADKGETPDKPVAAADADRASKAALAETGGGKVGKVESDNENGASYDVEVTKSDGSQVDVQLDDQFKVVGVDKGGQGEGGSEQK